jgi:hypothetical protein
MPELIISIAVNVALGLVLLTLFWTTRRREAICLADPEEAAVLFRSHFPDQHGMATLSVDRRSAMIDLNPGVGILVRHGHRWNARHLLAHEVHAVRLEGDDLVLEFADFGWPRTRLTLAPGAVRTEWLARLQSLPDAAPARAAPHA